VLNRLRAGMDGGAVKRERLAKALRLAQKASDRAAAARAALPPGSSRAKVTTANARWMRAAEERDRALSALTVLVETKQCPCCGARIDIRSGIGGLCASCGCGRVHHGEAGGSCAKCARCDLFTPGAAHSNAPIHNPTTACEPCGGGCCKVFGSQAAPR
jgi:hypothetical protein